jgi:hypothetical protein
MLAALFRVPPVFFMVWPSRSEAERVDRVIPRGGDVVKSYNGDVG